MDYLKIAKEIKEALGIFLLIYSVILIYIFGQVDVPADSHAWYILYFVGICMLLYGALVILGVLSYEKQFMEKD
jgi:ABC-type multidrug transport system permease subunit